MDARTIVRGSGVEKNEHGSRWDAWDERIGRMMIGRKRIMWE